jgi:hypothetical protein
VGANPVDRGKPGSKIQLACEGRGLPLTAVVTAANIPDVTMLEGVVDDIPPIRTPSGRRRARPGKLDADKGYDSAANRAYLRRRRITARIARRGIESSTRLGRHRWKVERALSWVSWYRRLGSGGIGARSGSSRSCYWPVRSRASTGGLVIQGRRLDAAAPPLRAGINRSTVVCPNLPLLMSLAGRFWVNGVYFSS